MDGTNLSTGAVTCVEGVANPIKVARAVMEQVTSSKVSIY